jgi:hypothetical protein
MAPLAVARNRVASAQDGTAHVQHAIRHEQPAYRFAVSAIRAPREIAQQALDGADVFVTYHKQSPGYPKQ